MPLRVDPRDPTRNLATKLLCNQCKFVTNHVHWESESLVQQWLTARQLDNTLVQEADQQESISCSSGPPNTNSQTSNRFVDAFHGFLCHFVIFMACVSKSHT